MRNSKELKVKYAKGDGPKKAKNKNADPKSELGYRDYSPYRNLPSIDIHTHGGLIDMSDTGIPLLANGIYLPPYSGTHKVPHGADGVVKEIPLAQDGKEVDSDYNMARAKQLYTPDETGHWPSVDYETGEWLKSKEHPTAWMEYLYGYTLNPPQALNYDVRTNPEGYFGDNTLQYVPKKEKGGSWLKQYQAKNSQVVAERSTTDVPVNKNLINLKEDTRYTPQEQYMAAYANQLLKKHNLNIKYDPERANYINEELQKYIPEEYQMRPAAHYSPYTRTIVYGNDLPWMGIGTVKPHQTKSGLYYRDKEVVDPRASRTPGRFVWNRDGTSGSIKQALDPYDPDEMSNEVFNDPATNPWLKLSTILTETPHAIQEDRGNFFDKISENIRATKETLTVPVDERYGDPSKFEGEAHLVIEQQLRDKFYDDYSKAFRNGLTPLENAFMRDKAVKVKPDYADTVGNLNLLPTVDLPEIVIKPESDKKTKMKKNGGSLDQYQTRGPVGTFTKAAPVTQTQPQQQKSMMFMTDEELKKFQEKKRKEEEERKRQEQQLALAKYTKSKHDYLMATDSNYRREFQRVDNAIKAEPYRQEARAKTQMYQDQIDRSLAGGTGPNIAVRETVDTQAVRNMRTNARAAAQDKAWTEVEEKVPAGIRIRNEPESYLPGYDKAMKQARQNTSSGKNSGSIRESTDTFNQFAPDRQSAVMNMYRNPGHVYFPEDVPPPPLNWRDIADPALLALSFAKYVPDPWGIGRGIGWGADAAMTGLTAYDTYENLKHGDYGHVGLGISSLAAGPFGKSSNRVLSQIGSGMGKVNKVYKMHKIYDNIEDERYVQGVLNSIRLASGNPVNLRRKEGGSKLPPHLPEAYREGGKFDKFLTKYQAQKSIVGQMEDWIDQTGRSVGKAIANNSWFSENDLNKAGNAAGKQIQQTLTTYDPNKSTARNIADTALAVGSLGNLIPTPLTQGIGKAAAAGQMALTAYDASQAVLGQDWGSAATKTGKLLDPAFQAMSKSTNPFVKGVGTVGKVANKAYSTYTTAKDLEAGSSGNIGKDIQTGIKAGKAAKDVYTNPATIRSTGPVVARKYGGHSWLKNYK